MKYPSINVKEVKETVDFYNENPQIDSPTPKVMGRTVEQFMESLNKRAIKDDKGLEKSLIVYRDNSELLTEGSIQVINKLLGDRKIREKIRIVNDGSYLVNRIWVTVDTQYSKIEFLPEFYGYRVGVRDSVFHSLPVKKQIDWLYNHFDVIYIQMPLVDCYRYL